MSWKSILSPSSCMTPTWRNQSIHQRAGLPSRRTWQARQNRPTGNPWNSSRTNAKSCSWGGLASRNSTEQGLTSQGPALQLSGWENISQECLWTAIKTIVVLDCMNRSTKGDWWKWSYPIAQHLLDPTWLLNSVFSLPVWERCLQTREVQGWALGSGVEALTPWGEVVELGLV